MNRLMPFLLLAAALIILPAQAQTRSHFYTSITPVSDYSEGEKRRAMKEGLEQVLIRLTGKSDIGGKPEVANILASASDYALEFGYVDIEGDDRQGLSVTYTGNAIDQFLRQHQLPIWPRKRTPVLLWILRETPGEPMTFVTPDEDSALYGRLSAQFSHRGMPVRYPLYDFEDQINLPVEEAWQFNTELIAAASRRYGSDQWLVIRCFETSGSEWRLAWLLGGEERPDLRSLEAESLDAALDKVVNASVDEIAARYTYIPGRSARQLALDITGVEDYASYRKLMDLISGLPMVKSWSLQSVSKRRVSLSLNIEGEQEVFVDALSLYDELSLAGQPQPDGRLGLNWQAGALYR